MEPKISIIVPVYNSEDYLKQTINSILNQSLSDYELLLINDGSTDESLSVMSSYEKLDGRIKCINKKNSGVSETRNTGIKLAKGEYIYFCDADDIIHKDLLKKLVSVVDGGCDIAVCNYVTFYKNLCFPSICENNTSGINCQELLLNGMMTSCCNKLIKRNLITQYNICFDSNIDYGEDLFFCLKCCIAAKNISFIDEKLYAYRLGVAGATSKYHPNLYETYKRAYSDVLQFGLKKSLFDNKDEFKLMLDMDFTRKVKSFAKMIVLSDYSHKAKKEKLQHILNDDIILNVVDNHWDDFSKQCDNIFFYWVRNKSADKILAYSNYSIFKQKIAKIVKSYL